MKTQILSILEKQLDRAGADYRFYNFGNRLFGFIEESYQLNKFAEEIKKHPKNPQPLITRATCYGLGIPENCIHGFYTLSAYIQDDPTIDQQLLDIAKIVHGTLQDHLLAFEMCIKAAFATPDLLDQSYQGQKSQAVIDSATDFATFIFRQYRALEKAGKIGI